MSAVVRHILAADPDISAAMDHYVDDIVVDLDLTSMGKVVEHLWQYGLETKLPEMLDGVCTMKDRAGSRGHEARLCRSFLTSPSPAESCSRFVVTWSDTTLLPGGCE